MEAHDEDDREWAIDDIGSDADTMLPEHKMPDADAGADADTMLLPMPMSNIR